MPEIIRKGDPTSHGGHVIEGSLPDICHGKPIAFVGHQTFCPKCKGFFPIVEGVSTTSFYGNGVAVAGMKTACGATLIATQFTAIVELAGGAVGEDSPDETDESIAGSSVSTTLTNTSERMHGAEAEAEGDVEVETVYSLRDEFGEPVDGFCYDLYHADQLHAKAYDFADGSTISVVGSNENKVGQLAKT